MSRTTHDINLDHHGTLESSRIEQGVLSTVAVGVAFGQYLATDSIIDVFISLDERLTAISRGYSITWWTLTADAFIQPYLTADAWIQPTFTCDAFVQPYFTADAEIQ
jgi:hypothetical protein